MMSAMRSALLFLVAILNFSCAQQNIYIWNSRLFIDGQEYFVKGVDYNPSPIGYAGNTGFCSTRPTPYGEVKSACYDSDFFDGTPWPQNTSVQGFMPLWQRDFPVIKAYGANTLRLYNTNPTSLAASKTYTNLFTWPVGKDHSQFMALAGSYGLKIAYPLYMYNNDYASLPAAQFKRFLRWQIDEVGNSSSLLYWVLGNEQAWTWDALQVNSTASQLKFNDYTDYIKRYTYSKWNRWIPVSMSIQWNYGYFQSLVPVLHLDFFAANIFTTSINGYDQLMLYGTSAFEGFNNASCKYSKPFLITEFGTTASTPRVYVNQSINMIWFNIVRNVQYGLLGGIYFEHTDEPSYGNKNFGAVQLNVSYSGSTNSTTVNNFNPDRITLKQQYYDLVGGKINGTSYNMNADEWDLIGRQPYTVKNVPDRCKQYKQCPGTVAGSPMCSGNGLCYRANGTCQCGTGWTGIDCATPVCPGSCSGRGICSTLVSPPECFCNAPYYGSSCQSVVSSPATVCPGLGTAGCTYGNGVCNNKTWTCACWPGWTGLDCAVTDLNGLSSTTSSSSFSISTTTSSTFGVTTSTRATTSSVSTSGTVTASVASTTSTSTTASISTAAAQSTSSSVTIASSVSSTTAASSTVAASSTASVGQTTTAATSVAASSSTSVGQTTSASTSNTLASSASTSASTSATTSIVATAATSTSAVAASTSSATTSAKSASTLSSVSAILSTSSSTTSPTNATSSAASSTLSATRASSSTTSSSSSTTASASSSSSASSATSAASSSTTSASAASTTTASTASSTVSAASSSTSSRATISTTASSSTTSATTANVSSSSASSSTTSATRASSTTTASSSSSTVSASSSTTSVPSNSTTSASASSSTSTSTRASSSSSSSTATETVSSTTSRAASSTTSPTSTLTSSTGAVNETSTSSASSSSSSTSTSTSSSTSTASASSSTFSGSTSTSAASTSTSASVSSSSRASSSSSSSATSSTTSSSLNVSGRIAVNYSLMFILALLVFCQS